MPRKKKTETAGAVEKLAEEIVDTVSKGEQKEKTKYVVVRDNRRVSDTEYDDPKDPKALEEKKFWKKVVDNWSPGEKVSVVKFNKKLHRVW